MSLHRTRLEIPKSKSIYKTSINRGVEQLKLIFHPACDQRYPYINEIAVIVKYCLLFFFCCSGQKNVLFDLIVHPVSTSDVLVYIFSKINKQNVKDNSNKNV